MRLDESFNVMMVFCGQISLRNINALQSLQESGEQDNKRHFIPHDVNTTKQVYEHFKSLSGYQAILIQLGELNVSLVLTPNLHKI